MRHFEIIADERPMLRALYKYEQRVPVPPVERFQLKDAIVYPPNMVATVGGEIEPRTLRKPKLAGSVRPVANPPVVAEPAVLLGSGQGRNYYHWLIEIIPKLQYVREDIRAGRKLVVPAQMGGPFQRDTLRYFGAPDDTWLELGQAQRFYDLVGYSLLATGNTRLSPRILEFFAPFRGDTPHRRVFITRRLAGRRNIVNEDEVLEALAPFGFEVVALETLSFADQVALMQSAAMVVAPHGAGLANIVFTPSKTQILELIHSPLRGVTSYAALADLFDLRVTTKTCETMRPEGGGVMTRADAAWVSDWVRARV